MHCCKTVSTFNVSFLDFFVFSIILQEGRLVLCDMQGKGVRIISFILLRTYNDNANVPQHLFIVFYIQNVSTR